MSQPAPRRDSLRTAASILLVAALGLPAAGCGGSRREGPPAPPTYPVRGKVVYKDGRPFAGGAIQFQSTVDGKFTTFDDIAPDGSFAVSLMVNREKLPGTVAGPHQVTVIPPMDETQSAVPIQLPQPYTVEARENELTITLDAAGP